MYSLLFLGFTAFIVSLLLTPYVRNNARRWGFVDQPDHRRKLHPTPIPRLGGIAILVSYLLAFGALGLMPFQAVHLFKDGLPLAVRIAPAVAIVFLIGIWDDLRSIRPWQKFTGQILAASVAHAAGVHITGFAGYYIPGYLTLPATIFWLVLCTNAVNLIDGVDGLAAGVGFFATATTLLAALLQDNMDLALAVAPLLGCLLGFLRYNFNPATIFLGDSGSLFIGFLLGCFSIIWSAKSATILGMTAPLLALAIPLLDTILAVARRYLRGQSIFAADHGHIHHRLLDRGLTPRRVALILYATCGLTATLAMLMMHSRLQGIAIILFCAVAWIGIQHLGYVEFGIAGRMFVDGAFRRHLNAQLAIQEFETQLLAAATPEDCWDVIRHASGGFGFHDIRMELAGRLFEHRNGLDPEQTWVIHIPIDRDDWIELTHEFGVLGRPSTVAPFVDIVRKTIAPKVPVFIAARPRPKVRAAAASSR